jgi:hypothetical protein
MQPNPASSGIGEAAPPKKKKFEFMDLFKSCMTAKNKEKNNNRQPVGKGI